MNLEKKKKEEEEEKTEYRILKKLKRKTRKVKYLNH